MNMLMKYLPLVALFVTLFSCNTQHPSEFPAFELLRKDKTGLDFENVLRQSAAFNVFNYMYFFNGGGVAAGDFNNDGKIDLYFTSNMGPNRMFLNEGNMHFKDVTELAGVAGADGFTTGVSVVDINNDGMLDLYIGQLGDYQNIKGQNQLFICKSIVNGIPVYEDEAIYYKLDLVGFSTQAIFFDFDLDGDLDLFQLNHSVHHNGTFGPRKNFETVHPLAGDKLFRNEGPLVRLPNGTQKGGYKEVTQEAGILSTVIGYGLGAVAGDINNDGYPDLYIGNDFHENDYLYINQKDGTFKEMSREEMMHTSQFTMGVEMADVNNDGWSDIFSLDMLPEDPYILKSSLGEDTYDLFNYKISIGYTYQYTRNNLQLNNKNATFSEIGLFAGVAASDWSWSALMLDFDDDGNKDLFVSNGIPRRMNDIDYVKFQEDRTLQLKENTDNHVDEKELDVVEKMPRIKIPNKFYKNQGNLRFKDLKEQIQNDLPTYSNGALSADLDGDGDLDIVVNNIENEPFIYKNLNNGKQKEAAGFVSLQLKGSSQNLNAIGARLIAYRKDKKILSTEAYPVRGFLSSAQVPLRLGIGDVKMIDSLLLIWPDLHYEILQVPYNQTTTVEYKAGLPKFDPARWIDKTPALYPFKDESLAAGLNYTHKENNFVEFNREKLIPFMVSREGPALAVGDLNGDGLEDVFLGSAKFEKPALFLQGKTGKFSLNTPAALLADSIFEDVDAVFVDVDNDHDLDLVVASGGNEFRESDEAMKQRLYLNDGKGNLSRSNAFPDVFATASCVAAADFNGDGLVDLFFGARAEPWAYGLTPSSCLLKNKGGGTFERITPPELEKVGLVKNAVWCDMDADGDLDLLLAMEYEPITYFVNQQGKFERKVIDSGFGWWNFVLPADFDGDGDLDILAGNLGENSRFHPTRQEPVRLFVHDFDDNGQTEPILTYFVQGKELPFANHDEIIKALPGLKKKILYAKDFAKMDVKDLFGNDKLAKAVQRRIDCVASRYFENTGQGFKTWDLPDELQFSPLMTAIWTDLNGDGQKEVFLGGNFYGSNIEMGRYDAFYGKILKIGAQGHFECFDPGIPIKGQIRKIQTLKIGSKTAWVLAKNNEAVQLLFPTR